MPDVVTTRLFAFVQAQQLAAQGKPAYIVHGPYSRARHTFTFWAATAEQAQQARAQGLKVEAL